MPESHRIPNHGRGMHPSGVRPRVLLVEDEHALRSALRRALEDDYTIVEAGCLEEAQAALERAAFASVLSDYQLPDGTGATLLARCREHQPRARRFLMSGANVPGLEELRRTQVVCGFLEKPFLPGELLAMLRRGDSVQEASARGAKA